MITPRKSAGLWLLAKCTWKLVIAYGDGRNGKSTYWNSIARVLGSYCGGISADALTANCKRNIKPEMAELKGKRMVIAARWKKVSGFLLPS